MKISLDQLPSLTCSVCRICGEHANLTSWNACECSSCGSILVANIPSAEELKIFYQSYNKKYVGGGNSSGKNQLRYAKKYLSFVSSKCMSGRLIDIGCANNPFPNIAAKFGFSVTAMDYTEPPALNESVTFKKGHLNDPEILSQVSTFDVVTAWAVIEHVLNPDLAFHILRALSKPGGWIFLTTPEVGTQLTIHAAGKTPWFYPPEHLHLLSPKAIEVLAENHQLKLVDWGHFEISPLRWIARYGIGMAEAILGASIYRLSEGTWRRMREHSTQKFNGIAWYVMRAKE